MGDACCRARSSETPGLPAFQFEARLLSVLEPSSENGRERRRIQQPKVHTLPTDRANLVRGIADNQDAPPVHALQQHAPDLKLLSRFNVLRHVLFIRPLCDRRAQVLAQNVRWLHVPWRLWGLW